MEGRFNTRNPAVKRIMQEMKELTSDPSSDFLAVALETDIFEWHFAMRGPPDTEFEGGIYHGRILLPPEYPFKPPSFMMLTPNGRFETGVKICLSISSHHAETWQPSWSVRTALTALIAFMPTPGNGAIGAMDLPKEDRRQLAAKSRMEPPKFGSAERQKVVDEVHQRLLAIPAQPKPAASSSAAAAGGQDQQQDQQQADRLSSAEQAEGAAGPGPAADVPAVEHAAAAPSSAAVAAVGAAGVSAAQPSVAQAVPAPAAAPSGAAAVACPASALRARHVAGTATAPQVASALGPAGAVRTAQPTEVSGEWGLLALAVALSLGIVAILLKKAGFAIGSLVDSVK